MAIVVQKEQFICPVVLIMRAQNELQGLVPPAVAVHLMGGGGAFLIALMLFMAVTASGSAEQVLYLVCF